MEHIKETPFGPTHSDPAAVESTLRRAQLALLNPGINDTAFFVNLSEDMIEKMKTATSNPGQLHFSSNVVCLDVSVPDLADLTLVDLPGASLIPNLSPRQVVLSSPTDRFFVIEVLSPTRTRLGTLPSSRGWFERRCEETASFSWLFR